jgi:dienelactone hydrolase
VRHLLALGIAFCGCTSLELDPAPKIIHARFDPDASVIPMPTDVLRDAASARLNLPNDTDKERAKLNATEAEFYDYLETLDGWSSLMSATVEFTGPIDPKSITDGTVQIWHWGPVPTRVTDARMSLSADGKKLTLDPPRTGWLRGDRYVALVRGGDKGLKGLAGEKVECDAAFYFLRQLEALDTPDHEHAFPGEDHDERVSNAARLEGIREDLITAFDFFADHHTIPRAEVAALWAFTVTKRSELAMDQPSQRIPLPIDLMIDPTTGRIDAPAAPWDSVVETEAKGRLSDLDGASLSGAQLFELTAAMDPTTVNETNIKLYQLGAGAPVHVPASIELLMSKQHIVVTPKVGRLSEKTTYTLVVSKDIRDATGQVPAIMPIGHFLRSHTPVLVDGKSQIHAIDDHDAVKLEGSRLKLSAALDALGRDKILAAWPFTTMSVKEPLIALRKTAETLATPADPANITKQTPTQAFGEFAIGIGSVVNVGTVYHGTIKSPVFLDKVKRSWRGDGGHEVQDIRFTMTMPKGGTGPVPVVIFGHGLVTERRFVLALGDALAAKGFAAITIDFPYHGSRSYCAKGGPISVVDPTDGSLLSLEPCQAGTTCNDEGRCVDAQGNGNALAMFPVISMPVASGARFLEIEHIANTKDHFQQALVDLGALDRALRVGNWQPHIGRAVDTSQIYYAGQSLGGIMGAIFLGTEPNIKRAVLNVPGANLVPMFDDSTFFSPQMDAFFTREKVNRDSFEGRRFINVAKWFMDTVDPQHYGEKIMARPVLLQMATLDMIIPNDATKILEAVTKAPRRDYLAEHAFLTIPIEPEFLRGTRDLANFLTGELVP